MLNEYSSMLPRLITILYFNTLSLFSKSLLNENEDPIRLDSFREVAIDVLKISVVILSVLCAIIILAISPKLNCKKKKISLSNNYHPSSSMKIS